MMSVARGVESFSAAISKPIVMPLLILFLNFFLISYLQNLNKTI